MYIIKTHDSESQGQEEAGRTRRTSELFTISLSADIHPVQSMVNCRYTLIAQQDHT